MAQDFKKIMERQLKWYVMRREEHIQRTDILQKAKADDRKKDGRTRVNEILQVYG